MRMWYAYYSNMFMLNIGKHGVTDRRYFAFFTKARRNAFVDADRKNRGIVTRAQVDRDMGRLTIKAWDEEVHGYHLYEAVRDENGMLRTLDGANEIILVDDPLE